MPEAPIAPAPKPVGARGNHPGGCSEGLAWTSSPEPSQYIHACSKCCQRAVAGTLCANSMVKSWRSRYVACAAAWPASVAIAQDAQTAHRERQDPHMMLLLVREREHPPHRTEHLDERLYRGCPPRRRLLHGNTIQSMHPQATKEISLVRRLGEPGLIVSLRWRGSTCGQHSARPLMAFRSAPTPPSIEAQRVD